MILHAKIAKLYQYLSDPEFSRVMRLIESANDEGLEEYEVDVEKLDEDIKFDLIQALEAMEYKIVYYPDAEIIKISL